MFVRVGFIKIYAPNLPYWDRVYVYKADLQNIMLRICSSYYINIGNQQPTLLMEGTSQMVTYDSILYHLSGASVSLL